MPDQGKKRMTLLGVGVKFAFLSILYTWIVFTSHFRWMSHLGFPLPRIVSQVIGMILLIVGIPVYLIAGRSIRSYFKKGELATKGIYAYIRHPIYGSWICFIMPGIVLFMDSLIGLTIPVFMLFSP